MGVAALVLPMLPGLVWLFIVYRTDRYEPEPKRVVLATFALGVLSTAPALLGELACDRVFPFLHTLDAADGGGAIDPLQIAAACFFVIGPLEELVKFTAVRAFVYRSPEFNEPLDGIIYAAAAALGFASVENVFYVVDFTGGSLRLNWETLGVRAFLSLPGHVIFATTWGAALGRRKFDPRAPVVSRLALASLLHGLYDFLLLYPPTHVLIVLYMFLLAPGVVRQIRTLRAASPFAPG
jgi:RsiW-degrading membrane proteinase PrsW (M82 family)